MILKKMAQIACLLMALGMAGAALGQNPVIIRDKFTDGKRNTNLWVVAHWYDDQYMARFQENSGRLRFVSNPKYTNSPTTQIAGWITTFIRTYNGGDTLNLYTKVRVPHIIPSDPGGVVSNSFELGLGLFESVTNSNYIEFTLRDGQSNREFIILYSSETLWKDDVSFYPAPTNLAIFNLRVSYSKGTDLLNFYWSDPLSNTWHKVRPATKMTDLFGPKKARVMVPYAIGYTQNVTLKPEWNVWMDNFEAYHLNLPKP